MSGMQSIELAIYYLIGVNLATLLVFGFDKLLAVKGGWRVPEAVLVLFVIFGGIGGAVAGRSLFRHKTRKASFTARLWSGALINLCFVGSLAAMSTQMEPGDPVKVRQQAVMAGGDHSACDRIRPAAKADRDRGDAACDRHSGI